MTALATMASLLRIPGFPSFTRILTDLYGPYGYSVTQRGMAVDALWDFVEGFVNLVGKREA